jgi:hypothetical protein
MAQLADSGVLIYDRLLDWGGVSRHWAPRNWEAIEREMKTDGWSLTVDGAGSMPDTPWPNARVVQPAADDVFLNYQWSPVDLEKPLCYFGAVHAELDVGLMERSQQLRGLLVVGPVQDYDVGKFLRGFGARMHPAVPISALPPLLDQTSGVLLPYAGSRSSTVTPAKIWNAIATRRPVYYSGLKPSEDVSPYLIRVESVDHLSATIADQIVPSSPLRVPTWTDRWLDLLGDGSV